MTIKAITSDSVAHIVIQRLLASWRTLVLLGFVMFPFASHAAEGAEFSVRDVNATEAAELLASNPDIRVLDVRTGLEFRRGHIEDAVNINYYSWRFKGNLDKLDKDVTWLVHCHSGVRSGKTLPLMRAAGFSNVIHLTDGIVDWNKSGLPVVK